MMTPELIIACVAEAFEVKAMELRSYNRTPKVDRARSAAYLLIYELTNCSLPATARELAKRDHGAALSGLRNARRRLASSGDFAERFAAAHRAALILAGTSFEAALARVDAMAVAHRVMSDPVRGITQVSALDLMAMAERLFDFEGVAGGAYQLNETLRDFLKCKGAADPEKRAEIVRRMRALSATLGSALAALGYERQPEQQQETAQ